jgi:hypothetical protein
MLGLLLHAVPVQAQTATQTWISESGDDANTCSHTNPCRTISGAVAKTAAGGKVSVRDAGDFPSNLAITKSVTITAEGSEGGMLTKAVSSGLSVSLEAGEVVTLHGFFFEGAGSGNNAIFLSGSGTLHIRNCMIRGFLASGFPGIGIIVSSGGGAKLFVSNCTVANNKVGISVRSFGGDVTAFLDNVRLEGQVEAAVKVDGDGAVVRIENSIITNNVVGLAKENGGKIISFGNNAIEGNGTSAEPSTRPLE